MSLRGLVSRCTHLSALGPLVALALGACGHVPPAARSPLREELATPDTPTLERATVTCLEQTGWTVDSVGTEPDGTRVVGAAWGRWSNGVGAAVNSQGQVGPSYGFGLEVQLTHLRIHPPGVMPRIMDAMHDLRLGEFWSCMLSALDAPVPEPSDSGTAVGAEDFGDASE